MFCLQCSKPILRSNFCNECWLRLKQTKKPNIREVSSFPVYTLWQWPMNHPLKALWLQKLKGQEDKFWWSEVAQFFTEYESPLDTPWGQDTLWIPLPSQKATNHALGFAQALLEIYGGTLWNGLEIIETNTEQKTKTRQERAERHIKCLGKPPCTSFRAVCLVDDIITTGSTFRGAFAALEYPENGLGLAVMDRLTSLESARTGADVKEPS